MPRGEAARRLPIVLQADSLRSQPDLSTVAEGHVEFRRGELLDQRRPAVLRHAGGPGQRTRTRAGGAGRRRLQRARTRDCACNASRASSSSPSSSSPGSAPVAAPIASTSWATARSRATNASYTSCPRDGPEEPAWVLQARSVSLDLDANEGVAEGAVLRFLGTPILALPTLSFPLTDARKSGWLPPSFNIDNRSGIELAVPYYWNIAPNRDATIIPRVLTRRGLGLDTEFRYLEPTDTGRLLLEWLPHDRVTGGSREALTWTHLGQLQGGLDYRAELARVSDDDWWKDFPNGERSFTARLLPVAAGPGTAVPVFPGRRRGLSADAAMAGAAGNGLLHRLALSAQRATRRPAGRGARRLALRAGDRIQPLHVAERPAHRQRALRRRPLASGGQRSAGRCASPAGGWCHACRSTLPAISRAARRARAQRSWSKARA